MDIELRRLGIGAQMQIAMALIDKNRERRTNCGRYGIDSPMCGGAEAKDQLWAAGGRDEQGGTEKDCRPLPAQGPREGK